MKTLGKIAIYQGTEYEFRKKTDGSYATYAVINNYKVHVDKENEEYYYEGKFPKQDVEIIEEKEKI